MSKKNRIPNFYFHRVYDISPSFLANHGIKGLILDVDNTLALAEHPDPYEGVDGWIRLMRENNIRMVILSNNWSSRVEKLAKKLDLPYVSAAMKPFRFRFPKALKILKLQKSQVAMVGDQVFTDILGGNSFGVYTVLVEAFSFKEEDNPLMRMKRKAEKKIIEEAKKKAKQGFNEKKVENSPEIR